jgi:glycosyltransferase involved in cell wall biosynthesis
MKIGYLAQQEMQLQTPPFDGPANHVHHVAAALTELGHSVRLLVNQEGRLWRSDDLTEIPDRGKEWSPVRVRRMDAGPARWAERGVRRVQYELHAPYAALFESVRFAQACRQELAGVDLLYERMSWVSYGGALAARWMGVPLVLENNGDPLADLEAKEIAPQGMQRRLSVGLMQRTVDQAAHVVTTGEGWRDQFLARWGTDPARVTTVENGTDLVRLLQRSDLRSFAKMPSEIPDRGPDGGAEMPPVTLVYVGGFLPWHGIDVLLKALARANARDGAGVRVRLLLVGAGDGLASVRQQAAELGLEEVLTFAGRLSASEFAPLLAQADIGVSPYCGWNEFSGLKILDYKAAGLPTITSGLDGRPATVSHGRTGLIVPPCDASALCDAILSLSADEERRRQMGRAARLEAEACHSWEHTARQLEAILMQVQEQWRRS